LPQDNNFSPRKAGGVRGVEVARRSHRCRTYNSGPHQCCRGHARTRSTRRSEREILAWPVDIPLHRKLWGASSKSQGRCSWMGEYFKSEGS
jgi:hypothetical protein